MEARRYLGKTQIDQWKLLVRNRRGRGSLLDICEAPVAPRQSEALVEVGPGSSSWLSGPIEAIIKRIIALKGTIL